MRFLILLLPYILFSNEFILDFKKEPYNPAIQKETISKIKETNYKGSSDFMTLLKEIYILAEDKKIEDEALSLYNNEEYIPEISWINRKGELITKKVSENDFKKRLESLKRKDNFNYKHIMFAKKSNSLEDILLQDIEKKSEKKILSHEDTFYRLLFSLKNKDIESSKKIFEDFVKKFYEARFNADRDIDKVSEINKGYSGDIYTLGAFINYDDESYDKYRKRALYFVSEERFNMLIADLLKFNERYIEASYHYELIANKDYIKEKLLNSYFLASKKAILNNEHSISWTNARKGLLLKDSIENKNNETIKELLEMKSFLTNASSYYVLELSNRGEIKHSKRVREETSELLNEKIL